LLRAWRRLRRFRCSQGLAKRGGMRKKALVVMLDGCRADAVENPIFA